MEVYMDKKKKIPTVHRITIDERLSEDHIRIEICKLIKIDKSGEFRDEPDYWEDITEEGEEIIAQPRVQKKKSKTNSYTDLMSIPKSKARKFPWKDLQEGQVFLAGEFKVREQKSGNTKAKRYFIQPGKKDFEQIDDDVKENTKTLYYKILAKGEKHGRL
jgi:hypothetical protein